MTDKNSNFTVLVTGAAKRLGRIISLHLAARNCDIVIHYHKSKTDAWSLKSEIEKMGRRAWLTHADLEQIDAPVKIFAEIAAQVGPINGLVNNASLFERDMMPDIEAANITRHFLINCTAPTLLMQEFVRQIPENEQGAVVNMLDQMIQKTPRAYTSYVLSKKALHEASLVAAKNLFPKIRINGLLLGAILPEVGSKQIPSPAQDRAAMEVAEAVWQMLHDTNLNGTMRPIESAEGLNQNRILHEPAI
jgi:NAD(P)-dependent dehydrogenase (short-subunit alcohol dehydrogenase family)